MNNPYYNIKRAPLGTTAKTGELCPDTGIWKVQGGQPHDTIANTKGDKMPPYNNKAVTYVLIVHG